MNYLCCNCHCKPHRPADSYCSDRCANKKRARNKKDMARKHQLQRAARAEKARLEAIEAERIYQHAEYMKRKARKLLKEDYTTHRLTPVVTIQKLNMRTWAIEIVEL